VSRSRRSLVSARRRPRDIARDDQRAVLGVVEIVEQSIKIGLERRACRRIDGGESFHDRAVIAAEDLDPM
jgi:hypothetical protein